MPDGENIDEKIKDAIKEEIGEKGKLGLVITGTAVTAFAASNLYIFGLSISIHQSLASHFEIVDYIQITPAWALPALLFSALIGAFTAGWMLYQIALNRAVKNIFPKMARDRGKNIPIWAYGVAILVSGLAIASFPDLLLFKIPKTQPLIAADVGIVGGIVYLVSTGSLAILNRFTEPNLAQSFLGKHYRAIIAASLAVLCFAFFYGAIVAPALVRAGTEVTVRV